MKKYLLFAIALVLLTGCLVTKVPVVTSNPDGTKTTNVVFAPSDNVAKIQAGAAAVAPLTPAPYGWIIAAAAGALGTAVASYIAVKNRKGSK